MKDFLILPHQLFEKKYLDKKFRYILWEHPQHFTKYNYNKKRLVMHRASMRYYLEYLKKNGFSCTYHGFDDKPKLTTYTVFDPVDKIKLPGKPEMLETPNFIMDKELYKKYRKKTKKFFFTAFYNWSKKEVDILPGVKSKDKENRDTITSKTRIPKKPSNRGDKKYIDEAVRYVNIHFKKNYGKAEGMSFPVTHRTAKSFLKSFIEKKLNNFGKFQDAMLEGENYLFHSLLSTSINLGLLNPRDVAEAVEKKKKPLNSVEGFIRQLFWREYQRYCYIYYNFESKNYFGNRKKLGKEWYTGKTGILPVDDCIKKAFDTGYLHHIERLMVIGNYMNLSGISPKEGFRWFMEFSCDSYEWVMHQNVYDMVFFVSGGDTMRRPYSSSSNYIRKMSNYKKGDWCDVWDKKYRDFIKKNKKKLHKFRYYFRL